MMREKMIEICESAPSLGAVIRALKKEFGADVMEPSENLAPLSIYQEIWINPMVKEHNDRVHPLRWRYFSLYELSPAIEEGNFAQAGLQPRYKLEYGDVRKILSIGIWQSGRKLTSNQIEGRESHYLLEAPKAA